MGVCVIVQGEGLMVEKRFSLPDQVPIFCLVQVVRGESMV